MNADLPQILEKITRPVKHYEVDETGKAENPVRLHDLKEKTIENNNLFIE